MPADLVDLFQLQLAQQSSLYDLTYLSGRKKSAERVASFFLRIQGLLPITTTLEVGAHEATFSRAVKKQHPERSARAYEANPHVYAHFLLEGELREQGVHYEHYAIGDVDGRSPFHIYDKIGGKAEPCDSRRQSTLLRIETAESSQATIQVPMARLDALCAGDAAESRYGLWIDAEGSSGQILAGAANVLPKTLAIIIELESQPKFVGQSRDCDIMATLLAQDFIPILRDFQFPHQYNAIFIKKDYLPFVEHEWHRFFQAVLRLELKDAFHLEIVPPSHRPIAPPPLPRLQFSSVRELRECMDALPLLRTTRTGIDPHRTALACHVSDLDEAIAFYRQQGKTLPAFYVLDASAESESKQCGNITIHDFAALAPGMDVQLYCKQTQTPHLSSLLPLTAGLAAKGITGYGLEKFCTEKLWRRQAHLFSEKDWTTALAFANMLNDADSQYTFMAVCQGERQAEAGYIPLAGYGQYCHPQVPVARDDCFFPSAHPTAMKLAPEGAELEAVREAYTTLVQHLPKLMVSLCHKGHEPNFLRIPELLMSWNLPYTYFYGHHHPWFDATILYACATN